MLAPRKIVGPSGLCRVFVSGSEKSEEKKGVFKMDCELDKVDEPTDYNVHSSYV